MSSQTKSENLVTAAATCRPSQPVLSYSRPFGRSQIAKCRVVNGTESNGSNRIFVNKRISGKRFGEPLYYLK